MACKRLRQRGDKTSTKSGKVCRQCLSRKGYSSAVSRVFCAEDTALKTSRRLALLLGPTGPMRLITHHSLCLVCESASKFADVYYCGVQMPVPSKTAYMPAPNVTYARLRLAPHCAIPARPRR